MPRILSNKTARGVDQCPTLSDTSMLAQVTVTQAFGLFDTFAK
jgi:hypothetical protein